MKHITNTALPLWVQGTQLQRLSELISQRFIPVPTGNTAVNPVNAVDRPVYPCTYREHKKKLRSGFMNSGLSLYLQGTHSPTRSEMAKIRFIPVPTGNTHFITQTPTVFMILILVNRR
jgi:hypothetical protein